MFCSGFSASQSQDTLPDDVKAIIRHKGVIKSGGAFPGGGHGLDLSARCVCREMPSGQLLIIRIWVLPQSINSWIMFII